MATNPTSLTKSCAHLFLLDDIPLDVTKNTSVKKLLRILFYLSILSLVENLFDSSVSIHYRYKCEFCAKAFDATSGLIRHILDRCSADIVISLEVRREPILG